MNKMNSEKWNEICFLLSENIRKEISENEFEQKVIQALLILGWKEYLGDFDVRPSYKIGAANSITPDFILKSEKEKLFVIEIKQPQLSINLGFQKQLFSYMRQLKLEYGLLIGQNIQIFYDGSLNNHEDPILLETIKFERNNSKGEIFVSLFSKENFSPITLKEFTLKSIEKLNRKEDAKSLLNKILSEDFKEKLTILIKQNFLSEFDTELIDSVLNEVEIDIKRKISEPQVIPLEGNMQFGDNKHGVITSIIDLIREQPKTQDDIVEGLKLIFPERSAESMRNTVKAQLGGSHPLRIEIEKNITVSLNRNINGEKTYFLNQPITKSSIILPIELIPSDEYDFKRKLLLKKEAVITVYYTNGTTSSKIWDARNFKESSGVKNNLRSRPEFRNGEWQKRAIVKVVVTIKS